MIKAILTLYFSSWWLPAAIFLVVAAPMLVDYSKYEPYLLIAFFALSGVFAASVFNIFKKRWRGGIANFLAFFVLGAGSLVVMFLQATLGPSEDAFTDGLTIPANIEIAIPESNSGQQSKHAEDAFQVAVRHALTIQSQDITPVSANIASLQNAYTNNLTQLRRYLATSPSWRVFQRRGAMFATRRWIVGSNWRYLLHGYYSDHDVDIEQQFQTRLTLGLSGEPWFGGNDNSSVLQAGETKELNLKQSGAQSSQFESHLLIETKSDLRVELFEQSSKKERRITVASLEYLDKEFGQFSATGNWPENDISHGQASLELANSTQPGIYDARILVNPGEAGMVYLKAHEVTKGTKLSAARLKAASSEWGGWSDKPDELFFFNCHFTIFEGDWGKPYAARFEVWFVPNSGKAERKLLERVYKIEGWQR